MINDLLSKNQTVQAVARSFAKNLAPHAFVVQAEAAVLSDALTYFAALAVSGGEISAHGFDEALEKRHPDVFYYPSGGRKTITVDDIKDINDQSVTRPTIGKAKVFLINASTPSSVQSWQGKLLKILEEPPQNTFIFIGVNSTSDLFDTIISRSVALDIAKLSFSEIRDLLIQRGYGEKSAEICALMSDGSIAAALMLINDADTERLFYTVTDALKNMTNTRFSAKYITKLADFRDNYKLLLQTMEQLFSEVIGFYDGITLLKAVNDVTIIAENYSRQAAVRSIDLIETAYKELTKRANFNMVFDNLILKILEVRYICQKS